MGERSESDKWEGKQRQDLLENVSVEFYFPSLQLQYDQNELYDIAMESLSIGNIALLTHGHLVFRQHVLSTT